MIVPTTVLTKLKSIVKHYVDIGILTKEQAYDIAQSESCEKILESLKILTNLKQEDRFLIWDYIQNNVYKGVMTRDQRETVLDQYEQMFLIYMLRNCGILTRQYALEKIIPTPHILDEQVVPNLKNMGIIDCHRLNRYYAIYIFSPTFYQEVKQHENH